MLKIKTLKTFPPITISNGSLEALKWIAAISMTVDHFARFFPVFNAYVAFCVGRLAMPLFVFIFAYNFARSDITIPEAYYKAYRRLLLFGILATPAYIVMRHLYHLWPLNIMFMLLITAIIFQLLTQPNLFKITLAVAIFLMGGSFVEYMWPGILLGISCWFFCRKPTLVNLLLWLTSYILINQLNGNAWALLSLLLIFLATKINVKIPRIPYFFYVYYVGHLTIFSFFSFIW